MTDHTAAERAGFIAEWELAIALLRWDLLQRRYRIAKQSHSGQRKARAELSSFAHDALRRDVEAAESERRKRRWWL